MSFYGRSLLDLTKVSESQIHSLFSRASELLSSAGPLVSSGHACGLLFFEPSTRTRLSFQAALAHMGIAPLVIEGKSGTSMEKGESAEDTILNVAAMGPKILVIRCGDDLDLQSMSEQVEMPIVNAGWGKRGHPTQALLDVFTMYQHLKTLKDKKILIIGDIKHSRVASSHFEILGKLGATVWLAAPETMQDQTAGVKYFSNVDEVLGEADVVMTLRMQFERHGQETSFSKEKFRADFAVTKERLKKIKTQAILLHPGPVNFGVELDREVLTDPRCRILEQVKNGVYIREALLREVMGT